MKGEEIASKVCGDSRGVSSPTTLVICPKGIISRVGRTGIPITLITWSTFLLSMWSFRWLDRIGNRVICFVVANHANCHVQVSESGLRCKSYGTSK